MYIKSGTSNIFVTPNLCCEFDMLDKKFGINILGSIFYVFVQPTYI